MELGRLGILPFFWLGGSVVFLWALRIGGALAATVSTFLFTTLPPVLAHAGLMTTDMAAAACIGAAALASLYWAERPTAKRSIVFGFFLALAVLAKFSALVFLPAAWMLMYAASFLERPHGWGKSSIGATGIVLGTAAVLVWAGYLFTFHRVEYLNLNLPAPALFTGLRSMWVRNQETGWAYLLGERSREGFWYFFPVVLAVKTPLALLLLTGLAGWSAIRFRACVRILLPLAFSLGILAIAMASKINIGSRHVLPVYVGVCVASGIAAAHVLTVSGIKRRFAVIGLLAWQLASGLRHHPDYLAYANEFAGGHPETVFADSDLDWGQDMKRLGARLQAAGATEVTMNLFNRSYLLAGHPFPKVKEMPESAQPPAGWSAISLTHWKLNAVPAWVAHIPPHEVVGRSIYLYYFPSKAARPE
ncbi:MAG: glycosyl transferase [Pirellulaceae bacterium]|nr:glycosyl transferase [Pirellulaceae bacterium]